MDEVPLSVSNVAASIDGVMASLMSAWMIVGEGFAYLELRDCDCVESVSFTKHFAWDVPNQTMQRMHDVELLTASRQTTLHLLSLVQRIDNWQPAASVKNGQLAKLKWLLNMESRELNDGLFATAPFTRFLVRSGESELLSSEVSVLRVGHCLAFLKE